MGKIIIDQRMLGGENFVKVAFGYADKICKEKGLTESEIQVIAKDLNTAPDILEFSDRYKKHFGDEIKLIIDNDNK